MKINNIERANIGTLETKASRICLGTWAIGGWMWGGSDEQDAVQTIRTAVDSGINFIDTAPVYGFGRSEEIVGKALKGYADREKVVIATKAGLDWTDDGKVFRNSTKERIEKEIDDSLKRLQTEYIDIYQIHWPDPLTPIAETAEIMNRLLHKGKIRAIGVSNYSSDQMDSFRLEAPIHSVQPPYNLFERQIENGILPYAHKNNIAVLSYGAICRGLLSGKIGEGTTFPEGDIRNYDPKFKEPRIAEYAAAVAKLDAYAKEKYGKSVLALAVRWVIDKGTFALWGARKPEQITAAADVFGWKLTEDDFREIDKILDETVKNPVGPEFMAPPAKENIKR
ncbi:aldo/keto reductase [Seleniivibrio sp.]|uniref:aldo/keto reductase n=1 Tax=Seleniivibrio sp. TaxID=2898801 RepID=UPI0025D16EB6|nr:aldo/keto reductase [Seleniivibrio sp.]MCD8552496.1 aldo/keto reductase [Seleniivibrio sp.]